MLSPQEDGHTESDEHEDSHSNGSSGSETYSSDEDAMDIEEVYTGLNDGDRSEGELVIDAGSKKKVRREKTYTNWEQNFTFDSITADEEKGR